MLNKKKIKYKIKDLLRKLYLNFLLPELFFENILYRLLQSNFSIIIIIIFHYFKFAYLNTLNEIKNQ